MYKNVIAAILKILETENNVRLIDNKVIKLTMVYLNSGVLHSHEKE